MTCCTRRFAFFISLCMGAMVASYPEWAGAQGSPDAGIESRPDAGIESRPDAGSASSPDAAEEIAIEEAAKNGEVCLRAVSSSAAPSRGPIASAKRSSTSISPAVHDDTATTCRTCRRAASWCRSTSRARGRSSTTPSTSSSTS